ncbi:DNA-binding transcriptional LysR family regulator [Amycolatopsis bartoniae]|uniref:Putative transcriptional regulator, LysR family protein n=1 Tax=Amycolatopsis bartoniae TaxID=941986 RepID=A0A8H9IXY1_9PSEU|nr:LysR family transcriptional regulator [Amycolatopsis bartoniae]MBB2936487.1 DNA-binding transcriptional LysR family regulator [Amycolatopsis bartoniae]TVT11031.1 LysR family transcriptional regulator [Amycolatopsis bartoniae]GHF68591.1 putative transcriptional regulator, LysR family protein [Amycolatopsis bartoniae]
MSDPSVPPVDLDLRLVQCFTVVAEHRHFGRAAEALHTTQPSLSRQIRRLEQQLGARLLDRTPRGTRLTEAGDVFLPLARTLLRSATQAMARTRAAAQPRRVTIGYTPGLIVTPAVRELRRRHPGAEVQVVHVHWQEVREALLGHRVDAAVTRWPLPASGLEVTVLYDEPRVAVLPLDHRLAGKESVTLDDIADEPLPRLRDSDPDWSAYWRLEPRPDGSLAPDGPLIDAIEDKFEIVATGEAISIAAGSFTAGLRPDLTSVPIEDVEPAHVVLATRSDDHNGLVSAFREYAGQHLAPY